MRRPVHRRQSWVEIGGSRPPRFWVGVVVVGRRGSWTGRKILLYLIIVEEVCSKVVTFEEKYNNLPRNSCK